MSDRATMNTKTAIALSQSGAGNTELIMGRSQTPIWLRSV